MTGLLGIVEGSAGLIPLWVMLWAARAALLAVLLTGLWHWRRRRAAWLQNDEERWPRPPRAGPGLVGFVLAAGLLVSVAGFWAPASGLTPQCLGFVALACLFLGHRIQKEWVSACGLIWLGQGIVSAALAWLPAARLNLALGFACVGVYFFGLARFWRRQLHEGRPWTTAGRLAPLVRRLAWVASVAAFCAALWIVWRGGAPAVFESAEKRLVWLPGLTIVVLILLGYLLVRDVTERRETPPARTPS